MYYARRAIFILSLLFLISLHCFLHSWRNITLTEEDTVKIEHAQIGKNKNRTKTVYISNEINKKNDSRREIFIEEKYANKRDGQD